MNSQKQIIALIKSFSGQANVLTIPRVYVDVLKSHRAALLLSQCVYWSDKTDDPDGWFYKTFNEWNRELGMNQHAVDTARGQLEEMGLVKTKTGKVNGTNKNHWQVDFEKLVDVISNHLAETASTHLAETATPDLAENAKSTIAKITTKINGGAGRARPDEHSILTAFCEESGIPEPNPSTPKENKAAAVLWWQPIRRMCQLANGRGPEVARQSVRRLRADKMTVSSPASIEKTFTAIFSENVAPASVRMFDPAAHKPDQVSAEDRAAALAILNKRLGR